MIRLVDILDESACRYPDKVAIRFKDRSFTYREVKDRVDRLAGALVDSGVKPQSHVAIIAPNTHAYVEIVFACARIGAVCEIHNTRLPAKSIVALLEKSNVDILFLGQSLSDAFYPYMAEIDRPLKIVLLGSRSLESELSYEKLIAAAKPYTVTTQTAANDAVLMLYTSGTTGMPRGVLFSHEALMARIAIDTREMQFSRDDVWLCALPLFHVTCVTAFVVLANGAELVISDSCKPAVMATIIERRGVTGVGLIPYLLRDLVDYLEDKDMVLDSLRLIVYGAEPMNSELMARCQALFTCGFLQGYGMTETASAVTMLLPHHHRDPRLLSTVGKAIGGMAVKIIDDQGNECLPGEQGEIIVRTKTLMTGYYGDAKRTGEVIKDGWYHTGDIGMLDKEGFLTLVDRKNNLVISGGENVYPAEVQQCIMNMDDDIVDVAVTGVPDDRWGESLAAFVVSRQGSGISAKDIIEYCSSELGGYKKPHAVLFVDSLGRKESGKISREQLEKLKQKLR